MRILNGSLIGVMFTILLATCSNTLGNSDIEDDKDDDDTATESKVCKNSGGSRLTEIVDDFGGGVSKHVGIYDNVLDSSCVVGHIGDGDLICVPSDYGGTLHFMDSNCSDSEAMVGFTTGTRNDYHREYSQNESGCQFSLLYRKTGLSRSGVIGTTIYTKSNGVCNAHVAPEKDFYQLGPVLSKNVFVDMTESKVSSDTRLKQIVRLGDDGSSWCSSQVFFRDDERDELCYPSYDKNGDYRCLASADIPRRLFSDSACMESFVVAVVEDDGCDSEPRNYVGLGESKDCKTRRSIHRVGELYEQPLYSYTSFNDQCSLYSREVFPYALVGEVPPNEFQAIEDSVDGFGDRIKNRIWKAADGFVGRRTSFYDEKRDEVCLLASATDGKNRCLPITRPLETDLFSDAQCQNTLNVLPLDACDQRPSVVSEESGEGFRIFEATPHVGTVYKENTSSECIVDDSESYLTKGIEISPTTFAEATRVGPASSLANETN